MTYTMRVSAPPIGDEDISKLEREIGLFLPDFYKKFLKKNNGGRPDPKYFLIRYFEDNPIGQIQDFFAINDPVKSCRIDWQYKNNKNKIPKNLFPIAIEDGGSLICISLSGLGEGGVYYWNFYGENNRSSDDNVYVINESFDEFIDGLYFYDPLAGR